MSRQHLVRSLYLQYALGMHPRSPQHSCHASCLQSSEQLSLWTLCLRGWRADWSKQYLLLQLRAALCLQHPPPAQLHPSAALSLLGLPCAQEIGHRPDDRLCTTLIRLCSAHGAAAQALGLYDWMRSHTSAGGAGLRPTVFTYTAAMRAALNGNLPERAMQVRYLLGSFIGRPHACIWLLAALPLSSA